MNARRHHRRQEQSAHHLHRHNTITLTHNINTRGCIYLEVITAITYTQRNHRLTIQVDMTMEPTISHPFPQKGCIHTAITTSPITMIKLYFQSLRVVVMLVLEELRTDGSFTDITETHTRIESVNARKSPPHHHNKKYTLQATRQSLQSSHKRCCQDH